VITKVRRVPVSRVVVALVATALTMGTTESALSVAAAGASGPTKPLSTTGVAHWRMVGSYVENSLTAGEGLAPVTGAT